eukprot:Gb_26043 [translate_table: standard]
MMLGQQVINYHDFVRSLPNDLLCSRIIDGSPGGFCRLSTCLCFSSTIQDRRSFARLKEASNKSASPISSVGPLGPKRVPPGSVMSPAELCTLLISENDKGHSRHSLVLCSFLLNCRPDCAIFFACNLMAAPNILSDPLTFSSIDIHYQFFSMKAFTALRQILNMYKSLQVAVLDFSRDRKMMSVLCSRKQQEIMFSKGAPESIVARCTNVLCNDDGSAVPLTADVRAELEERFHRFV